VYALDFMRARFEALCERLESGSIFLWEAEGLVEIDAAVAQERHVIGNGRGFRWINTASALVLIIARRLSSRSSII